MWIAVGKHQICGPRDSPEEESRGLQTGEILAHLFRNRREYRHQQAWALHTRLRHCGGRMRHSEADGQNQTDVGRAIHSERSGRTSGGNGHLNLGTPHPDDTVNQGYCRTSPTYLKTNLPKWRTLAVSTAVKHNGRGRSQRQPQKDILSEMPKLSSPQSKPALRPSSMPRSRSSAWRQLSLSCPCGEKRIQKRRLIESSPNSRWATTHKNHRERQG